MTFIERLESVKKLWAIMLPSIELPPDKTFCSWLNVYGDKEFETAVIRVPRRIRNWEMRYGRIDPVRVYKLMSTFLKIAKRIACPEQDRLGSSGSQCDRKIVERNDTPQSKRKEEQWNA